MHLKVLLPNRIFADKNDVKSLVAQTSEGSMGLLAHRRDFVAVLIPGILAWQDEAGVDTYAAVDDGVLVKTGMTLTISVRNAIGGTNLGKLHEAVEREFINLNTQEKTVRTALAKLEIGLMRRLAELNNV